MKVRIGFVSNSSSSSFLCGVCGEITSGWDISIEDTDMLQCVEGHIFCRGHSIKTQEEGQGGSEFMDKDEDPDQLLSEHCPLCQLESITDRDLATYLLRGRSRKEVLKEIKSIFTNYEGLIKVHPAIKGGIHES